MNEYNEYAEYLVEELEDMQKRTREMRKRVLEMLKPLIDPNCDEDHDWWFPQSAFADIEVALSNSIYRVKQDAALLTLPPIRFYHYHQNNSGGKTYGPSNVIIEAPNYVVANEIAEKNGLYWNGVRDGKDCQCCGDRWYPHDDESEARFKIDPIDDANAKVIYLNK